MNLLFQNGMLPGVKCKAPFHPFTAIDSVKIIIINIKRYKSFIRYAQYILT